MISNSPINTKLKYLYDIYFQYSTIARFLIRSKRKKVVKIRYAFKHHLENAEGIIMIAHLLLI